MSSLPQSLKPYPIYDKILQGDIDKVLGKFLYKSTQHKEFAAILCPHCFQALVLFCLEGDDVSQGWGREGGIGINCKHLQDRDFALFVSEPPIHAFSVESRQYCNESFIFKAGHSLN